MKKIITPLLLIAGATFVYAAANKTNSSNTNTINEDQAIQQKRLFLKQNSNINSLYLNNMSDNDIAFLYNYISIVLSGNQLNLQLFLAQDNNATTLNDLNNFYALGL